MKAKNHIKKVLVAVVVAILVAVPLLVFWGGGRVLGNPGVEPPRLISYQGRLTNASGQPLSDGSYTIEFRLYGVATGGTPTWNETQTTVAVVGGLFNVLLGSVQALTVAFITNPLYLEVVVQGEVMTPRQQLVSVPFALRADDADKLDGLDSAAFAASSALSTPGTINSAANPVDWTKLKNVPAGLADGVDDVGAGGGVKQLVHNFVVASGKSVTAGDAVGLLDGYVQKEFVLSRPVFNSAVTPDNSVAALSSTKFVAAYRDRGNSDYGTAVIGDVSAHAITYGSEYVFNSAMTGYIKVAALSSTKFVAVYADAGNLTSGTAVIGVVSGNTITYGSEYVLNPGTTGSMSVAALSSTKFVAVYKDGGNSSYGTAVIGDVSGNTITYGSEYVFNSAMTQYLSVAALSSTKFVAAYADVANSDYGTAVIGVVSGNTVFYGSEYVFNSASTGYTLSVAALSPTQFVAAYDDVGNSSYGTAVIGDVSGNIVTYGSERVFNSAITTFMSVAAFYAPKFVVIYRDEGNSDYYGTAVIGDVSGNTITYGSEYVLNSAITGSTSVAVLYSTTFVAVYMDGGNSNYGTAVIGDVSGNTVTFPIVHLIGVAKESRTAGQTAPVIIGGVSDVHSGLIPGAIYYSDVAGALTTTPTGYKIGLAISGSEILLSMQLP